MPKTLSFRAPRARPPPTSCIKQDYNSPKTSTNKPILESLEYQPVCDHACRECALLRRRFATPPPVVADPNAATRQLETPQRSAIFAVLYFCEQKRIPCSQRISPMSLALKSLLRQMLPRFTPKRPQRRNARSEHQNSSTT
jgi:hypothetical protein